VKGSYGVDAPYLLVVPAVLIVINVVNALISGSLWPLAGAVVLTASVGSGLYTSRLGKFRVWSELLDALALRGDERVLDLGCGRGAVLLMAAGRLTSGRAVGVDVWRGQDQSGNSVAATMRNAAVEGVSDRVEVHTADMAALPFDDESFDVVVSNVAIHNISDAARRDRAVVQAARVLRPGGRLLIADIRRTREYSHRLSVLGMTNVQCRGLGWRMWWSGPWMATRLVTAAKPARVGPAE
jgi:arsenite methyltransferase